MHATDTPALSKRLAAYSAAAGLALAAAPDADAQIDYTDVDPDLTLALTDDPVVFDFDGDGTGDFFLAVSAGGGGATTARVVFRAVEDAPAANGVLGVDAAYFDDPVVGSASRLSAGAEIGPDAEAGVYSYGVLASLYNGNPYYPFLDQEGYLGFRFEAGAGTTHYGWARISTEADEETLTATLFEYAFEGTAEMPIVAGATGVANEDDGPLAGSHRLAAAHPNPFTGRSAFTLEVAASQDVDVAVYDLLGRRVATLHRGALAAGQAHAFEIDGAGLPSGLYVVRARGDAFTATTRVTLAR